MTRPSRKEIASVQDVSGRDDKRRFKGISLLETLLALGIGGIVLSSSIYGVVEYTDGVKVQASASLLGQLTEAADQYAAANYEDLVTNAPQTLPISVVEPYFGDNVRTDAFGNTYELATRTYPITVPDPGGGTRTEDALQVLVVARGGDVSLTERPQLRAQVANTMGADGAFITQGQQTCLNGAGATRPDGHICGAYGSFSLDPGAFPTAGLGDAAYAGLVTKGDSSVYDDALQRYDFGDPELNTMSTNLIMAGGTRIEAEQDLDLFGRQNTNITARDLDVNVTAGQDVAMAAGQDVAVAAGQNVGIDAAGAMTLGATDRIRLDSDANTVQIGGNTPRVTTDNDQIQLTNSGRVNVGRAGWQDIGGAWAEEASGDLLADTVQAGTIRADEITPRTGNAGNDLRINNKPNSITVFGNRAEYHPRGSLSGSGGRYEVGAGSVLANNVTARDVTCADCGGSLAAVLPKWRHMGTYFISTNDSGVYVPKPACTSRNRRWRVSGGRGFGEPGFADSASDGRYATRIIVVPKQYSFYDVAGFGRFGEGVKGFNMRADNAGNRWLVRAEDPQGISEGLAMTYCVFLGGERRPNYWAAPFYNGQHNNTWGYYRFRD
mgnify:CR=1 FL=1